MHQADLFAPTREENPLEQTAQTLKELALKNVFIGSSSWKYESWKGSVYSDDYPSKKSFEQNCLKEYSRIFTGVGGDFSFYNYPSVEMTDVLLTQTPRLFKVGLKCTEFITLKHFPNIPRWGKFAGRANPDFLNPNLFIEKFIDPIVPLQRARKLAPIIMEFTAFQRTAFKHESEFIHSLGDFLQGVRRHCGNDFEFGIEVRTKDFISAEMFASYKKLEVTPIINSWTRTPPMDTQFDLFKNSSFPFLECRPIMKPGRTRDEAIELFEPYAKIKETNLPARRALKHMIDWALEKNRPAYIFINNHLEGCAYQTISELVSQWQG